MQTLPLAPIGAITPLATTAPVVKLRFDASGRGTSQGHTVMYPASSGSTPVMFRATAEASPGTIPTAPVGARDRLADDLQLDSLIGEEAPRRRLRSPGHVVAQPQRELCVAGRGEVDPVAGEPAHVFRHRARLAPQGDVEVRPARAGCVQRRVRLRRRTNSRRAAVRYSAMLTHTTRFTPRAVSVDIIASMSAGEPRRRVVVPEFDHGEVEVRRERRCDLHAARHGGGRRRWCAG